MKENLTLRGISKQKIKGQTIQMNDLINPLKKSKFNLLFVIHRFELLFNNV